MTKGGKNLISDNPSIAQIKAALPAVKLVSKLPGAFSYFGNKNASQIKTAADDLLQEAKILDIPDRFNETFVDQGWVATGSFSMDVMSQALDYHENDRLEEAR